MRTKFLILLFISVTPLALATSNFKYWVEFADKNNSIFSLDNPSHFLSQRAIERRNNQGIAIDSTDLPVNDFYIDSVVQKGVRLLTCSKWHNGITISVSDTSCVSQIAALPFVKRIEMTYIPNYKKKSKVDVNNYPAKKVGAANDGYGNAYAQINMHNGDWLHQAGYKGEGIVIAVMDAGFLNVNVLTVFKQAFNNAQLLGTKDFVQPNSDIFKTHYHGSHVLSVMAAYDYNSFIGTAPDASYWLFRTEDSESEFPVEADNLVAAIEYADSVGVDIITASLGYYNFDNPVMSFTYANMNGKICRASVAETMAARKGILVVNSAGNEGANPWRYITAPADADSVLTVGSVNTNLERSPFSAWGPTADGRIKPTVSALGTNVAVINTEGNTATNSGTSLACPIIAGLAACLWQALPHLTNMELYDLIVKHGNLNQKPNFELGYGIPDFYAAYTYGAGISPLLALSKDELTMYASPTEENLILDVKPSLLVNRKMYVVLQSISGKKFMSERIRQAHTEISLQKLKPGVYNALIKSDNTVLYREKLIKK